MHASLGIFYSTCCRWPAVSGEERADPWPEGVLNGLEGGEQSVLKVTPVKQNRLALCGANSLLSSLLKLQGGHRHSYLPFYISGQSGDSIGRVLDLGLRCEDLHLFYKILAPPIVWFSILPKDSRFLKLVYSYQECQRDLISSTIAIRVHLIVQYLLLSGQVVHVLDRFDDRHFISIVNFILYQLLLPYHNRYCRVRRSSIFS